jgi:hypothetical protein
VAITDFGIDVCNPSGVIYTSPCPGHHHVYCFNIIPISTTSPPPGNAVLSIAFPPLFNTVGFYPNNNNTCNVTPSPPFNTGNLITFSSVPLNCNVCIEVDVDVTATAPYTTIANYTSSATINNLLITNNSNPDFNAGNSGFITDYTFVANCNPPNPPTVPDEYFVCTDASTIYPQIWSGLGYGGVGDKFLQANGNTIPPTANTVLWENWHTVSQNTNYSFSAWFNNITDISHNYDDPEFNVLISNTPVVPTQSIPESLDVWIPVSGIWCSESITNAGIKIHSPVQNLFPISADGNDIGLDELSFFPALAATAFNTKIDACACDPNDLIVSPAGCSANGNVGKNQKLNYRIRFQNVGAGNAHNILIRDPIDNDLDLETLEILSSSHTITHVEIIPDRTLIIKFDGIELPPLINDPQGCNGFIEFRISPKSGLADGTAVTNQAGIYFDNNGVVYTNTTLNTLYDKPTPDARFKYKHDCEDTHMIYDFTYTGNTADNATFYWEFTDGVPSTSTDQNPSDIVFTSEGTKLVTLVVNRYGCTKTVTINVEAASVFVDQDHVTVCHYGNEIVVSVSSLPGHLAHGDCLGSCQSGSRMDNQSSGNTFDIRVYPNPSSGNFSFQSFEEACQLVIYDVLGKEVERFERIEPQQSLSFGLGYLPGVYIATFSSKENSKQIKLIKQKAY